VKEDTVTLSRVRRNSKGFTLIEVMIVIVIIGILGALALPQFSSYRARAFCSRVESDVRNSVSACKVYFATYEKYPTNLTQIQVNFRPSPGVTFTTLGLVDNETGTIVAQHSRCTKNALTFSQSTNQYTWANPGG